MLCDECKHKLLLTFREGKYSEVRITIYKCLAIPNHPVVFKRRTVRGKLMELKRGPIECKNFCSIPAVNSEKFREWRKQGVKFPYPFRTIPDNWWERKW